MKANQDLDQLRLLSIFHYVAAGIVAICAMVPVLHLVIGIAMVTGAFEEVGNGQPPPPFVGWFFVWRAFTDRPTTDN